MRRLRLTLAVAVVAIGALVGAVLVDASLNHRAASICNREAEKPPGAATSSGYTIQWEWSRLAYVCRYDAPGEPTKRVGFTTAFL